MKNQQSFYIICNGKTDERTKPFCFSKSYGIRVRVYRNLGTRCTHLVPRCVRGVITWSDPAWKTPHTPSIHKASMEDLWKTLRSEEWPLEKQARYAKANSNKLCGRPPQYAPAPCKFIFDLLTLKMVSESRVTWPTSVPILVFLGLYVLDLGPMYATDRQTSDARHRLMPPTQGRGIITLAVLATGWRCAVKRFRYIV